MTLTGGSAAFDASNVGTGKTVSGSGFALAGAATGNYQLGAVATTSASITARERTVMGITANGKPWDSNNVATLNVAGAEPVGVVEGDPVTLHTAAPGTFASSNVGLKRRSCRSRQRSCVTTPPAAVHSELTDTKVTGADLCSALL